MPAKNLIILVVSIVIVITGGFLITGNKSNNPEPSPIINSPTPTATASPSKTPRPRVFVPTPTPDTFIEVDDIVESPTPVVQITPSESPTPVPVGSTLITFTNSGYEPSYIEIEAGTIVTFENDSTSSMWPASNNHPTHTLYPGSNISFCKDKPDKIFDACKPIQPGEFWSFQFDEKGTWKYHDHLSPGRSGIILVK